MTQGQQRLTLSEECDIIEVDEALAGTLGYTYQGLIGCQFESILTKAASVLFHLSMLPRLRIDGKVERMHLALRTTEGRVLQARVQAARLHAAEQRGLAARSAYHLALDLSE
ncbi:hypothetical protein IDH44_02435 [Paenibacillus sp. IB182496]|uniref:PAS domain S-box-containing protein n=1 Tax=Paenibacillus sabuli TaxID=2772509 RepID=A0A927GQ92_9BACL|nr:hypothetical protein [Paenibacillus sabuli]MBD2844036.1 hypothetical protein [Paenibacillus sabuli]